MKQIIIMIILFLNLYGNEIQNISKQSKIQNNPLFKQDFQLYLKATKAANQKDYQSAIHLFHELLSFRKKTLGNKHPATIATYDDISNIYEMNNDYTHALEYAEKSLKYKKGDLKSTDSYNRISWLYKESGQYDKALEYAIRALQLEKKISGSTDPKIISSYERIAWVYTLSAKYVKALEFTEKAMQMNENTFGEENNHTVNNYIDMSFLYEKTGNYNKALTYAKKALRVREKNLTENDPLLIFDYNNISWFYERIQEYKKSLKYAQKVLSIQEKTLGKTNKKTLQSYNTVSRLYTKLGNYNMALKYIQKTIDIKEIKFGKMDISTTLDYDQISSIYASMQDYEKALLFSEIALKIRKKNLAPENKYIVLNYNDLSFIYSQLGRYQEALKYRMKALRITQKTFGEEHLNTANNYSSLGMIYLSLGDYLKALEYQKKALKIREKILGRKNTDTAGSYINIGMIYQLMRDYSKALKYYKQALSINEIVFGSDNLSTATSYISLGSLYSFMGRHSKALSYNRKALSSTQKVLGENNTATAVAYTQAGFSYQCLGYYQKASKYYHKALEINKKILGENNIAIASSLAGLGSLYNDKGDFTQSLEYYQKALSIVEYNSGKDHFLTGPNYYLVGSTYQNMHNQPQSHHYAQLAFDNFLLNRDKVFTILNSKQKEKYLKSTSGYITLLLKSSYAYIQELNTEGKDKESKQILQNGANAWLNYKGSIFDSENTIAMLYSSNKNKKLKAQIENLVTSKRYLAKLYQSLPKPKEREVWKKKINETEEKIAKLTNELASKADSFKQQQDLKSITYKDITSHLAKDELYIDYAKVENNYYLFSLDNKENISFIQIDQNSSKEVDSLIKDFREDINTILKDNNITDEKLKVLTQSSKEKLSKLYTLVIEKPLGKTIKNKPSLIISSDGALRLLPFETLYDKEKGKYLIEEKEIRYIPSGKELVRLYKYSKNKTSKGKKSTIIFANPNFNSKIASLSNEEQFITPNTNRSGIIKSLFRMRFAPLPGTKAEAKEIEKILKDTHLKEYEQNKATESNLLQTKKPKILHIATHGFFINDNTIPNPMLKSGIALAGANTSVIRGKSDGVVTALKLSGLDLKGTDLVVLSACQTGVVDINSTDSVSGLSKAFIQAGAKNIVMSLWSVNDQATKELMTSFYTQMKGTKKYAKALRAAKLKMIIERKHPFYWGAFVLSGE